MNSNFEESRVDARPAARYANYFEVGVTPEEVLIDLGQAYGEGEPPIFHTRIVTSAGYARSLAELLERSLHERVPNESVAPSLLREVGRSPGDAAKPRATLVLRRSVDQLPGRGEPEHPMLTEAVTKMMTKLGEYLPPPAALPLPQPSVSLVRLQEKQVGLGQWRGTEERNSFPVAQKGLRLAATARFQIWAGTPDAVEQQIRVLTEGLLGDRDALVGEGFLELSLKDVTVADHLPTLPSWRQVAEFDLLYEYQFESADSAGGLITRIPVELRRELGSMLVAGDLTLWDETNAPPLAVRGGGAPVTGLSVLMFAPGAIPADSVEVTRTFANATGAPATFATLDNFLAAVAGPNPASTHASFTAPSLTAFLNELGPAGAAVPFVDQDGTPRLFPTRSKTFPQPIALASRDDRLEVTFGGAALNSGQLLYLRAVRGQHPA